VQANPAGPAVERIEFNPDNAQVRVVTRIVSRTGTGVLTFTPSIDANKRIVWSCGAEDIQAAALPPDCR
jgi:hypothetical protein